MILQHPETGEKVRVRYNSPLSYDLRKQGYRDVTPPRTAAQIETTDRWLARGRLELAKSNLEAVIRDPFYNFMPNDLAIIKQARDMIAMKCNSFPMSAATHKRLRKQALSNTDENTP